MSFISSSCYHYHNVTPFYLAPGISYSMNPSTKRKLHEEEDVEVEERDEDPSSFMSAPSCKIGHHPLGVFPLFHEVKDLHVQRKEAKKEIQDMENGLTSLKRRRNEMTTSSSSSSISSSSSSSLASMVSTSSGYLC
ncbi:hypothetical protein HMI54_011480 [Coelomomyces lativittatus]|nr:hypothetical protein HMI56_002477 [Coelomomyces lativittatus]KAJ1515866.1 hypothetical protein HMI54_011480 [Coelomomyces lativittatus]KAJ1517945.1 hypothetical protein HMI55_004601 [Coelomomyces lativittatus]